MKITAEKLTDESLMQRACEFTINKKSNMTLEKIYKCEHSPMRTQLFWIEMEGIPSFVSVHLVRHKIGVEHFVQSMRDDRCGDGTENRETPVNHAMLINAEALVTMARKRLCKKAHEQTVKVMQEIREAIRLVDYDLSWRMIPDCEYRGMCYELVPCFKEVV